MKIKKINDDKLKIILSSNDLDEKNIDIDSFLANPIESQNLFFEILDLAEEQYDFDIENNKAIIEAISLDNNNIFILTITKLTNESCTYKNNSKLYCFENVDDLLGFFSFVNKSNIKLLSSDIYKFENSYYFLLNNNNFLENFLLEFATPLNDYNLFKDISNEYGNAITQKESS